MFDTSRQDGAIDIAADLALSTFSLCASNFPFEKAAAKMKREDDISPVSDAAKAMEALLIHSPQHFISNQAIALLGSAWEASYAASNRTGILTIKDRVSLCTGICHVLASLPPNQRAKSLLALAMPSLDCLEAMLQHANVTTRQEGDKSIALKGILERLGSEIIIVTRIAVSFSEAIDAKSSHPPGNHVLVQEPALSILKRSWPLVSMTAAQFNDSDVRMLFPLMLLKPFVMQPSNSPYAFCLF